MSSTQANHSAEGSDTQRFLQVLFQEDHMRAWVTAFTQDPFAPSQIPNKEQASKLSARMWAGGVYRTQRRRCTADANQYVAVSIFKAAPWVDRDGVEHITPKRRKSHFERACAVMIDDIGRGQKVEPGKVLLPCTAMVETSPGNCQGWYALDPEDEDSYNAELVARLIERMVAAGLTKDLTDPGMRGVTRYGRLPGGINNKPGRPEWTVKLRSLYPKRVYTVQDIADAYSLDLTAPPPRQLAPNESPAESLVTKLAAEGLKPVPLGEGKFDIQCPWMLDHTDKVDSGTAYFEPAADNNYAGGFKCHHGHCENHGIRDLFRWLDDRGGGLAGRIEALRGILPAVPEALPEIPEGERRKTRFSFDELMATDYAPTPWLVEDLLAPGLTLLAAPPKAGKSYLMLQMALCVAAGVPFLGRQTRKVKTTYFNLEEWAELIQQKGRDIKAGQRIVGPVPNLHMVLELDKGVSIEQEIQRQVDDGVEFIIIDLLARVRNEMNEDSKKNAYVRDYEALRLFADLILQRFPQISIAIVHHTNKGQHDAWQDKISGSQGLAGASHCNMLLASLDMRGLDDEGREEAKKFRRFHAVGKLVKDQELMLMQLPDMGGWTISDKTTDEVKASSKHKLALQVLREAGDWMTAKQLHEHMDGTLDSTKKLLQRMVKKGEVQSAGQGGHGYRLTPGA